MADLQKRIAALEATQRPRTWSRVHHAEGTAEEAAAAYEAFLNPMWVPTAEEALKRDQWALLTDVEAAMLYAEFINDPHFDVNRAVCQIVEGRETRPGP